eukprot:comp11729_c1_seq1/m.6312 comp11729_c1_seq1/g.6312  ORF comp11729_c1_seq1/g.6312 comp11729_c1_seq1/m.6312 type:complete len:295 (-) comp11729_c1_seq1:61-945(-)
MRCLQVIALVAGLFASTTNAIKAKDVVFAVNAGGPEAIDSLGIRYKADLDDSESGTVSDFGLRLLIGGVKKADMPLYQTERYHDSTFGYTLPKLDDGPYVLVAKFSEVWFEAPNEKVFHIRVGGIDLVENVDIFREVGKGHAHDEIGEFEILNGGKSIKVGGKTSKISGPLRVEFVKTSRDNPKVCAFYVAKGTEAELAIPRPQPPKNEEEEEEEDHTPVDSDDEIETNEEEEKLARERARSVVPSEEEEEGQVGSGTLLVGVGAVAVLLLGAGIAIFGRSESAEAPEETKKDQ